VRWCGFIPVGGVHRYVNRYNYNKSDIIDHIYGIDQLKPHFLGFDSL
jgi:hypothetical protein